MKICERENVHLRTERRIPWNGIYEVNKTLFWKSLENVAFRRADKQARTSSQLTDEVEMARIQYFLAEDSDRVMAVVLSNPSWATDDHRVLSHLIKQNLIEKEEHLNTPYYVLEKAEK